MIERRELEPLGEHGLQHPSSLWLPADQNATNVGRSADQPCKPFGVGQSINYTRGKRKLTLRYPSSLLRLCSAATRALVWRLYERGYNAAWLTFAR